MKSKIEKESSIGQQLMLALTDEQIVSLLDEVFTLFKKDKLTQLFSTLEEDVSTTLSQILNPSEIKQESSTRIASNEKLIEEWDDLWREWNDVVFEVGDEEGKYVNQDYHYDPPYFCPDDVADDLEKVAEKLLPLIDKIYQLDYEKDAIFRDALVEVGENALTYPEWMGAEYDAGVFETATTKSFLKWEWHVAQAQKQNAVSFIKQIIAIEDDLKIFSFNDETVIDFFVSLPENARKDIYKNITSDYDDSILEKHLASSLSKWYRIYHEFSNAFDPQQYFENCRNSINEDWKYGLPLLKHLIEKRDYQEAEKIVKKTCDSCLSRVGEKKWKPEEFLFINYYYFYDIDNETKQLLKYWLSIAEGLDQAERTAALKLQIITYEKRFNWDDVIEVFKKIKQLPFSVMTVKLFQQWQLYILKNSIDYNYKNITNSKETWIFWLLDTGFDETKDKSWFENKVNNWFESLLRNPSQFKEQQKLIYTLTNDLAQDSTLNKQHPKLFKYILKDYHTDKKSRKSQSTWLKRMNGQQFIPKLMECWRKNVGVLVPDPATAHKSRYGEHAVWMNVVRELNPTIYNKIINQWKLDHRRRKNLWQALKEQNLPF